MSGVDDDSWRVYRRAKGEWSFLWLAFVPLAALVAAVFDAESLTMGVFIAVYVSRLLWVTRAWQKFPCPRCEKPFISGRGWSGVHDLFPDRKCKHCGLAEFALLPPASLNEVKFLRRLEEGGQHEAAAEGATDR